MKILITGATGFLGSYLVKALLADNHDVIILKRSFSNTLRIDDVIAEVTVYDIDKCDLRLPFVENEKIDMIIHTATCYGRNNEGLSELISANLMFPVQLLELAIEFGVGMFCNTDTALNGELNSYALSKKQFLQWGQRLAREEKIHFVNMKLEHIYGPGDDVSKFITRVIRQCLDNVPELLLTKGEQQRDFVYIDDVVRAYMVVVECCLTNGNLFCEYCVGSGKLIKICDLVSLIKNITDSSTDLRFGAIPYRENEAMESVTDNSLLLEMGWRPTIGLVDGIKKIVVEG